MMNMLLAAAVMIEEASLGEQGVDLFVGTMPADVTRGVMLRAPLDPALIDEGMQDFYDTEFQVIVRDEDPSAGYERAVAIGKALKVYRVQAGDLFISWMRPRSLPVSYPRGDADDIETSVRIQVGFGDTAP